MQALKVMKTRAVIKFLSKFASIFTPLIHCFIAVVLLLVVLLMNTLSALAAKKLTKK